MEPTTHARFMVGAGLFSRRRTGFYARLGERNPELLDSVCHVFFSCLPVILPKAKGAPGKHYDLMCSLRPSQNKRYTCLPVRGFGELHARRPCLLVSGVLEQALVRSNARYLRPRLAKAGCRLGIDPLIARREGPRDK